MNRDETKQVITACATFWPHSTILVPTQERMGLDLWAGMLVDVDLAPAIAVVTAMSAEGREHSPPVGLIRKRVIAAAGELPPSWEQAWAEVRQAITAVGRNGWPTFKHRAIRDAVAALGWSVLCGGNTDVMPGYFRKAYEPIAERAAHERLVPAAARAIMAAPARSLNA